LTIETPLSEYQARLTRFVAERQRGDRDYRNFAYGRLLAGAAGVAVAAFSIGVEWISPFWLALPAAAFAVLAIRHASIDRSLTRAIRAAAYYERALARIDNRWIGAGRQGTEYAGANHLYAADLDVVGRGSLFELLSTARTATGERTLASWLLAPGELSGVKERQQSISELAPRIDLREDLAVLGDDVRAAVDDRMLAEWGARDPVVFFHGARWMALGLALAALCSFIAYMLQAVTLRPFLYVLGAEVFFSYFVRAGVRQVTSAIATPTRELRLLALMLGRLERESFASPGLVRLRAGLTAGGRNPTAQIHRLERLVDRMDWARNMFFTPIAAPLLWIPQCAMAIECWRVRNGAHIGDWVAAIGEMEALGSLAAFAYERPTAKFPELLAAGHPQFEADALAHPLIAPDHAVPNDVSLGGETRLWIVSGSNMSGKSTLLRAVGLSVVLAWAGAPVTAARLRLSRLHLGASLATHDSLADNRSRFYAEITRLREIADLASSARPALFLLDELLSGTNSHDRRLGAEAVIKSLVDRGAIGMVTTHDLALSEIAAGIPGAINVHFEDHLEGGEIRFDYRLRGGAVERGNALALMRAIGLNV
jgi:hypothetical protein